MPFSKAKIERTQDQQQKHLMQQLDEIASDKTILATDRLLQASEKLAHCITLASSRPGALNHWLALFKDEKEILQAFIEQQEGQHKKLFSNLSQALRLALMTSNKVEGPIHVLLEQLDPSVWAPPPGKWSVLMEAARSYPGLVPLLIPKSNVDAQVGTQGGALHLAAKFGYPLAVKALSLASKDAVNQRTPFGWNPLMMAIQSKSSTAIECVKWLLPYTNLKARGQWHDGRRLTVFEMAALSPNALKGQMLALLHPLAQALEEQSLLEAEIAKSASASKNTETDQESTVTVQRMKKAL